MSIFMKPRALKREKPVTITRPCYAMAVRNGADAEITMYGEIVSEQPWDWWNDEPIKGNFIILDEFLDDLKTISGVKNLTIRLNSLGGDGYASITIHNRLRELNAFITIIVDGVAMSGGSVIMCAGDLVKVNPGSIVMIHKGWTYMWGGYNADEMHKVADAFDVLDRALAAIYHEKSGLPESEILALMSQEKHMTGADAVDMGFADEITEGKKPDIKESANKKVLTVNGHAMRVHANYLPKFEQILSIVETVKEAVAIEQTAPVATGGNEGGDGMSLATNQVQTAQTTPQQPPMAGGQAVPAAAAQVQEPAQPVTAAPAAPQAQEPAAPAVDPVKVAAAAERKRIQDIDAIASQYDDETVQAAKYGEHPITAQEMAYNAALKNSQKGKQVIKDLDDDAKTSGASAVGAAAVTVEDGKPLTPEQRMAQGKADAQRLQKKEESK